MTAFTRGNANFKGYVEANFYDSDKNGALNGVQLGATSSNYGGMVIQTTKFGFPSPTKVLSATDALKLATSSAGASKVRDAVDKYLIAELQSYGTSGKLISDESSIGGAGTVAGGTPWTDANGNGIPDDVESKFKNVEDWANSLVSSSY